MCSLQRRTKKEVMEEVIAKSKFFKVNPSNQINYVDCSCGCHCARRVLMCRVLIVCCNILHERIALHKH